jgi:cold-inducible RNA-binding protein
LRRRTGRDGRRTAIPAKIFVGNLSFRTTKEELTALLAGAGTIVDVFLPTDRATGKMRGFAFVEFGSESEAAEAIRQFNGKELGGRAIRLNMADEKPRDRSGPPRERSGPRPFVPFDSAPEPSYFAVEGRVARPKGSRRGVRGRKRSL